MNISEAEKRSGLPIKTIRYYEEIGLIQPARTANGYRDFDDKDLHVLSFLARARSLGFPIDDCRALLGLYEDRQRTSAEVKQIAQTHLDTIETKLAELHAMQATLTELVNRCHGNDRPECPILEGLAGED
jgi:Cu(I)-responsive transcriptional regulator